MPALNRTCATLALAGSLAACARSVSTAPAARPVKSASATAPAAAPTTPDAGFRQQAPAPGPEIVFAPPKIEEARLSNGARVLFVERHDLPVIAIDVTFDRGADQGSPGLGGFVGALLLAGTRTKSAIEISDAFESMGAEYGADAAYDYVSLSVKVLVPEFGRALPIVADVLKNASYPKEEVERARSRRLTALAQESDSPARLLGNTVIDTLYPPGHPYNVSLLGTEAAIKSVTPEALRAFHAANVRPDHATIAVAGDVGRAALLEQLEKALGDWHGKARAPKTPTAPPSRAGVPRVVIVDRPGATQSMVAVATVGVPRATKDFDALLVANTLLGGSFSSRLNMNLREKHAYTYGARSGFDMRHGPGPFTAGGAIVREATAPAITEIFSEIKRVRSEPVPADELEGAKSYLVRQLPARFETASETATSIAMLAAYGLPLDEYATRAARLARVTSDDVQRVANAYLTDERLRVVAVGDASAIRDGLEGLKLGPVEVRAAVPGAAASKAK